MARLFDDGSSQYLDVSSAVVTAVPFTFACWATNTAGGTFAIMSITDVTADDQYFHVYWTDTNSLEIDARNGGTIGTATAGLDKDGVFRHVAGVFASATSRTAYGNGTAGTPDTTNVTPAGVNHTAIGGLIRASPTQYYKGNIALPAVWDVALTAAEIASLAKGADPRTIRPASLVAFWPVHGRFSPEPDIVGGFGLTVNNAPTVSTHPRLIRRRPNRWMPLQPAAGGAAPTDLSAAGAAVGTLATASQASADLSGAGVAVGTLATASRATANLSAAGAAVGTLAAAAVQPGVEAGDLSTAGAAVGTLASASRQSADLSAAGAAVGTLATASAQIVSAALSADGVALGTLDTGGEESAAYLTWGSQARRRRARLEQDEEELLAIVAAIAPKLFTRKGVLQ